RDDADDAAGFPSSTERDMTVDRVAVREQAPGDALAHHRDRLRVRAVVVDEVAAGEDRHPEHREEPRRDGSRPACRALLARRTLASTLASSARTEKRAA